MLGIVKKRVLFIQFLCFVVACVYLVFIVGFLCTNVCLLECCLCVSFFQLAGLSDNACLNVSRNRSSRTKSTTEEPSPTTQQPLAEDSGEIASDTSVQQQSPPGKITERECSVLLRIF